MAERILTLFGEEIIPDPPRPEPRSRAKKEQPEKNQSENAAAETSPTAGEQEQATPKGERTKPAAKTESKEEEKQFVLSEEWKGDKKYYTIGEVAELFKVKTSHIRFWTNEFKLKVRTTKKGDRLFTAEQVRELRAIHHLVKERGFTLSGAKAKLKAQNKMDVETVDLKESLKQLRNKLLIIRNQLI